MRPHGRRSGQEGIAIVTALAAAVVVSITAAAVLGLTWRRLELSAFRADHDVAVSASEAGVQYALARLDLDAAFRTAVQNKTIGAGTPTDYIVTCHNLPGIVEDQILANPPVSDAEQLHVAMKLNQAGVYVGGKHVVVRIRFHREANPRDPDPLPGSPNSRYRISARTEFGTGGP